MRVVLGLLLGVLLLIAASASFVKATEECKLNVFNNGCFLDRTCVRKWGECPDVDYCNGNIELATDKRCDPTCVGFGVFSDCPVDISKYNLLLFGAELCLEGDVQKCALQIKIELEDANCKKYCLYCWIVPQCNDYVIVLKAFKCLNLCKITGLFLLTAFDIVSYSECQEAVLIIKYIAFVDKPYYSVWDNCSSWQYEGNYFGPNSLYYWPCLPCPVILTPCDSYTRALVIPCGTWGAGFCGICQDLSCFKYLTFYLKSNVDIKVEIKDDNHCKADVCVPSTCGKWCCIKLPLCDFSGVDLCKVGWQFLATKIGCADSEVKIANIRYTYCEPELINIM